jgi:hypothetical protein
MAAERFQSLTEGRIDCVQNQQRAACLNCSQQLLRAAQPAQTDDTDDQPSQKQAESDLGDSPQ